MKPIYFTLYLVVSNFNCFCQSSSIINIDSIFINGEIPVSTSKKIAENYFGKNLKKEIYEPGCGYFDQEGFYNVKFLLYKKNGVSYIVYKKIAEFDEVLFTKKNNNFLQISKLKLNYLTTLKDLKKYFPKSYNVYRKEQKINKQFIFRLKFDKKSDDSLIIELNDKNVLVRCSYFSPC